MRLFFLCFEPLGRYNGYHWPYNPFNAQPSVGNVRLSAVESKLKFAADLNFQIDAINSVVDLFDGQSKKSFNYTSQVIPNLLNLSKEKILENLQKIQEGNGLPLSNIDELKKTYNFTIEMETGTGKTYVYLRTILELNQKYGWTKFIIVVPSVAIKEGVLKTLDITKEHFRQLYNNYNNYNNLPYTYFLIINRTTS
jgi:type III restriction enzyme